MYLLLLFKVLKYNSLLFYNANYILKYSHIDIKQTIYIMSIYFIYPFIFFIYTYIYLFIYLLLMIIVFINNSLL